MPIYEPGLAELIESETVGRLHFSSDARRLRSPLARLLFVAVGTPPTYSGDADLSAVHSVVNALPASDGHALVMKLTVPCGDRRRLYPARPLRPRQGRASPYVSCPEFLKEGAAVADFLNPDRVVVGDEGGWAGDAVVEVGARRSTRGGGGAARADRRRRAPR